MGGATTLHPILGFLRTERVTGLLSRVHEGSRRYFWKEEDVPGEGGQMGYSKGAVIRLGGNWRLTQLSKPGRWLSLGEEALMLAWAYVLGCRPGMQATQSHSQEPSHFCKSYILWFSFQILNTSQELKDTDLGYLEVR